MKRLLFTFVVACTLFPLKAQDTLTLKQCISMGIENNLQLQTKRNECDEDIAVQCIVWVTITNAAL